MTKKWYNYFVSTDPLAAEGSVPDAAAPMPPAAPGKSAAQTVADIAAMIQPEPAFTAPTEKPVSFGEIYEQAAIAPPPHGYSILKIIDMLQSEHIRNLPAEVKRSSVLVALEAAGVVLKEIIEDAVKRDRALDTYERVLQKSVEDLEQQKLEENKRLEQEMERLVAEYRARIQANTEALTRRKEEFFGWRLQKQHEEKRIADAVGYFVSENPVTTASPPAPRGEPKKDGEKK